MLRTLAALVVCVSPLAAQDGPWRQYADPAEAGFDAAALDAVCAHADSTRSGALMAVYRGHVVLACGDVARELDAHSVRKSLVSALYGTAVARGEIDLDITLGEVGIDDDVALTDAEKEASLRDLISARSGIFLPAAYAPSDQDEERPARGAHAPGTYWFYNNWDFNVAGVVFERLTGVDLYDAFAERIARPLGMEDWTPADGDAVFEPPLSRHPAHTFRISARDLARIGQLYLQEGGWDGRQILPASWIEESTQAHSEFGNGRGYGYMWWTYAAGSLGDRYPAVRDCDVFMGRGTGGQAVAVLPCVELVVVHRGDTDHNRHVGGLDVWSMIDGIAAARTGEAVAVPRLVALAPRPLASQLPPAERATEEVPADLLAEIAGRYEIAPNVVARIYEWNGDAYVHMPGEGDAKLWLLADGALTVRVQAGVRIGFERDVDGKAVALLGAMGPQRFRAQRIF